MKITILFLLFLTFLLRGGDLFAQPIGINVSFTRSDVNCIPKFRVTMTASGGTRPYLFKLDSLLSSTTGVFESVSEGWHTCEAFDSSNYRARAFVFLDTTYRPQYTWSYTGNCNQAGDFILFSSAQGAVYRLNGNAPNTDSAGVRFTWTNVSSGGKSLSITMGGCTRADVLELNYPPNSYVSAGSDFLPNRCGDSLGTLKISLFPYNVPLASPLSMSFNGRPFSSDLVFTNIEGNRAYPLKIQTSGGCSIVQATVYVNKPTPIRDISYSFYLNNCAARTGQLFLKPVGGYRKCSYFLDGQLQTDGDSSTVLQNVALGSHIVKVRSADGCEFSKTIVLTNNATTSSLGINYYTTCGQAATLSINLFSQFNSGRTYQFANGATQRDTARTLSWQNVLPGNHPIRITDSLGCVLTDTIKLYGIGGFNATWSQVGSSCSDTNYRVTPIGGRPPYTYVFGNGEPTTSNQFSMLRYATKNVVITDANNCRITKDMYAFNDSVQLLPRFIANCLTNTGTLILSVIDTNAARPLSISFNGRPFSSDTIFPNVRKDSSYSVLVKSKQGCDLATRINLSVFANSTTLRVIMPDTCSNRLGMGRLGPYIYGGVPPYRFAWNTGQNTYDIVAPLGQYSVTVTDAQECQATATARVVSCVWSGDTDTSGVVDNRDLLNIGLAFGETGSKRCFIDSIPNNPICTQWVAQKAADWSKQTPDKTNYKHIDTNGDGIVNGLDTVAIVRNWSRVHQSIIPQTPAFAPQSLVPPIYVQTSNVREGDWASFPIKVFIDAQNLVIQKVTVLDIVGKVIQTVSENAPLSISTAGTYFLKIETDKGVLMKKVVRM